MLLEYRMSGSCQCDVGGMPAVTNRPNGLRHAGLGMAQINPQQNSEMYNRCALGLLELDRYRGKHMLTRCECYVDLTEALQPCRMWQQ